MDNQLSMPKEHRSKWAEAIDDTLGLVPITLRLQKPLVEQLKKIAASNGLGYQPFVRQILTQYVREHEKAKEPIARAL